MEIAESIGIRASEPAELAGGILEILENAKRRSEIPESRKMKQKAILNNLPADFADQIREKIAEAEDAGYSVDNFVAGYIFEVLVRADPDICGSQGESEEAAEIRSLMKNPGEYRLEKFGLGDRITNPDLILINGKGEFTGAVEAKTSEKLDFRSAGQIGKFKRNIAYVLKMLRFVDKQTLRISGLKALAAAAANGFRLKVADKFITILAVPHTDSSEKIRIEAVDFPDERDFKMAEHNLAGCTIKESPFDRTEIRLIKQYLLSRIR